MWTQSVTRSRWLAVRLGLAAGVAVIFTTVFSLLFTWWSLPLDRFGNRIGTANFGQRGIAPIAYVLFGLALGTLLGAITRRTLPAMAATLTGFGVTRFVFQWVARPHLLPSVVTTRPSPIFGVADGSPTAGAWVLSSHMVDKAGHAITPQAIDRAMVRICGITRESTPAENMACVRRLGIRDVVHVHPADQFWPLQGWEALVFVALAAAVTAACFWWIRHRVS